MVVATHSIDQGIALESERSAASLNLNHALQGGHEHNVLPQLTRHTSRALLLLASPRECGNSDSLHAHNHKSDIHSRTLPNSF